MQLTINSKEFFQELSRLASNQMDEIVHQNLSNAIKDITQVNAECKIRLITWQIINSEFEDFDLIKKYLQELTSVQQTDDLRPALLRAFTDDKYLGYVEDSTALILLKLIDTANKKVPYFQFLYYWMAVYFYHKTDISNFMLYSKNLESNFSSHNLLGNFYSAVSDFGKARENYCKALDYLKLGLKSYEVDTTDFNSIVDEYFIGKFYNKFLIEGIQSKISELGISNSGNEKII